MSSSHLDINTDWTKLSIEDVVKQVRAIREFPAHIKIYDRAFRIDNELETNMLINGLEIGYYLALDKNGL